MFYIHITYTEATNRLNLNKRQIYKIPNSCFMKNCDQWSSSVLSVGKLPTVASEIWLRNILNYLKLNMTTHGCQLSDQTIMRLSGPGLEHLWLGHECTLLGNRILWRDSSSSIAQLISGCDFTNRQRTPQTHYIGVWLM